MKTLALCKVQSATVFIVQFILSVELECRVSILHCGDSGTLPSAQWRFLLSALCTTEAQAPCTLQYGDSGTLTLCTTEVLALCTMETPALSTMDTVALCSLHYGDFGSFGILHFAFLRLLHSALCTVETLALRTIKTPALCTVETLAFCVLHCGDPGTLHSAL